MLTHGIEAIMFIDRILAVVVSDSQGQGPGDFVLGAHGKYPLIIPVEILVPIGVRPVDPFGVELHQKGIVGLGRHTERQGLGCLQVQIVKIADPPSKSNTFSWVTFWGVV